MKMAEVGNDFAQHDPAFEQFLISKDWLKSAVGKATSVVREHPIYTRLRNAYTRTQEARVESQRMKGLIKEQNEARLKAVVKQEKGALVQKLRQFIARLEEKKRRLAALTIPDQPINVDDKDVKDLLRFVDILTKRSVSQLGTQPEFFYNMECGEAKGTKGSCPRRDGSENALMPHQWLVGSVMWPEFETRGIALLHPVGSGKTCSGISAINTLVAAMRLGKNNGYDSAFIIVPKESLVDIWKKDISCTCGSDFLTQNLVEHKNALDVINEKEGIRLRITFVLLTRKLEVKSFENSFVIWDECQNAKNPKGTTPQGQNNAAILYDMLMETKRVKMVLLSAGFVENSPADICVLNLVKPRNADGQIVDPFPDDRDYRDGKRGVGWSPASWFEKRNHEFDKLFRDSLGEIDSEAITRMCKGLTSYVNFQSLGRNTVYPGIRVSPYPTIVRKVKGEITYTVDREDPRVSKSIQQILVNVERNLISEIEWFDTYFIDENNDSNVGTVYQLRKGNGGPPTLKMEALLNNVKKLQSPEGLLLSDGTTESVKKQSIFCEAPGMVAYVQNQFLHRGIADEWITLKDVPYDPSNDTKSMVAKMKTKYLPTDKKRWISLELGTGETKNTTFEKRQTVLQSFFNLPENADGSLAAGILFGKTSREGKSFFDTNIMHLPGGTGITGNDHDGQGSYVKSNRSMRNQVLGRITRFMSHCRLDPDHRYVRYMFYIFRNPTGDSQTKDMDGFLQSGELTDTEKTLRAMEAASIDASLYSSSTVPAAVASGLAPVKSRSVCFIETEWVTDSENTVMVVPEVVADIAPITFKTQIMPPFMNTSDVNSLGWGCRGSGKAFVTLPPMWTAAHEIIFVELWIKMWEVQMARATAGEPVSAYWARCILGPFVPPGTEFRFTHRGVVLNNKLTVLNSAFASAVVEVTEYVLPSGDVAKLGKDLRQILGDATIRTSVPAGFSVFGRRPSFEPRFVASVEQSLFERAEALKAGKFIWSTVSRSSRWNEALNTWAVLGEVPTDRAQGELSIITEASADEQVHLLWVLIALRGRLCSADQQRVMFETVVLEREMRRATQALKRAEAIAE